MDDAWAAFGPVARPLGVLAAAAGRADEAAQHLDDAIALSARWGAPGWELAAIADRLRVAHDAPEALRSRGMALARDLELPWVATDLAPAW
jgi:hypothetical protein